MNEVIRCLISIESFFISLSVRSNFWERRISWETNIHSGGQEIVYALRSPKFHRCIHKCLPMEPLPDPDESSPLYRSLFLSHAISSNVILLLKPGFVECEFPVTPKYIMNISRRKEKPRTFMDETGKR